MAVVEGRSNWVPSGARTATGVAILANDPHRRIEVPARPYFVHLVVPGCHVTGGSEPPVVAVHAGSPERLASGFTFAATDVADVFVEADLEHRRAYAVQSAVPHPGTAAYWGGFQLAPAMSCADGFARAMPWLVPPHDLICRDTDGHIALQVTGLAPDGERWNGRLPVPGTARARAPASVHAPVLARARRAARRVRHRERERRGRPQDRRPRGPRPLAGERRAGPVGTARKRVLRHPARTSRDRAVLPHAGHARGRGARRAAQAQARAAATGHARGRGPSFTLAQGHGQ